MSHILKKKKENIGFDVWALRCQEHFTMLRELLFLILGVLNCRPRGGWVGSAVQDKVLKIPVFNFLRFPQIM